MEPDQYARAADRLRAEFAGRRVRFPAAFVAWEKALPTYTDRARVDGVNIDYFAGMITDALTLFEDFDSATNPAFPNGAREALWAHQEIGEFGRLDPRGDIDVRKVKEIADRYAASPFIEDYYFSWCLIDSLIGAEIRAFTRVMLSTRYGSAPGDPAFFAARGDAAKYRIMRPVFDVIGFIVNYATPAAIGYWAVEKGHEIVGGLFYAIAAMGVFAYVASYNRRKAVRARNVAMLAKTGEIYAALACETVPVDALRDRIGEASTLGVRFDRTVLSLMEIKVDGDAVRRESFAQPASTSARG